MKNGIYLFVVLFLGIMGYFVVNHLMMAESVMLAGIMFLIFSGTIVSLVTHYKKRDEMSSAQKFLNVVYVGIFTIYGFVLGTTLIYSPMANMSLSGFESVPFIIASIALLYRIISFIKSKVLSHH